MKLLLEDIRVEVGTDNRPVRVIWRLRPYQVKAIEEEWCYAGKWWLTDGLRGHVRIYYRLTCVTASRDLMMMEVYQQWGRWKLSRVLD
jgi:hypothetical protein